MFLALHPMDFISLNSSGLLEHLAMLLIIALAVNCLHGEFLGKAISIISLARHFLDFVANIVV